MKTKRSLAAFAVVIPALLGVVAAQDSIPLGAEQPNAEALASIYVVDFVSTAAFGAAINDLGDVTGTSYPDPGCGSSCLPPLETVVWKGDQRIVLPSLPGFTGLTPGSINNQGWVVGFAGLLGFGHAVAWKPNGDTYTAIDMGVLPGTTSSSAIGMDDSNRAVGYAQQTSGIQVPFMWTEAGGLVNLASLGFPSEIPTWISRGGTVSTVDYWYRLGDPASVTPMAPTPRGFLLSGGGAINDAGDQARFLVTTSSENLVYPFRYSHTGSWQQIGFTGTGHLSTYGVGGINDNQDITATVLSAGMAAAGPDGLLQDLAPLVSTAYGGNALTKVGSMNASGQILASMIIGRASRLVKLTPSQPCTSNCIQVTSIQMKGKGPAFCDQGSAQAQARITVKSETGAPLSGVRITGHFLDDYWLDETVVGQTNANGQVTFKHVGPPCVGAIAFLVTNAESRPARTFDRTTGILTNYVIPLP